MKLQKTELLKALDIVSIGLATKEMIEQTTSFAFRNGRVITYNDEISVSTPYDIGFEGAIQAQEFKSIISKMKGDEIEVELTGTEVLLHSGRSKAGITVQSEILLPLAEVPKAAKWVRIGEQFIKAITFAMNSCGRDMSRAVLTCVHILPTFVEASDGMRICQYTLNEETEVPEFLLPANVAAKIVKADVIAVSVTQGWAHFRTKDKAIISCRIFEENFPDTSALMKAEGEQFTFPNEALSTLDRAGVFSKRDHMLDEMVELSIGRNRLVVKAKSDAGWYEEKVPMKYKGEQLEFMITPYLLRDIISQKHTALFEDTKLLFTGEDWKYLTLIRK
jgi:DNA polymerase III sliding clamp (beta) subunit (PCNA family)